jgi:hypothetical protein
MTYIHLIYAYIVIPVSTIIINFQFFSTDLELMLLDVYVCMTFYSTASIETYGF